MYRNGVQKLEEKLRSIVRNRGANSLELLEIFSGKVHGSNTSHYTTEY